jgi:hypothetical protein
MSDFIQDDPLVYLPRKFGGHSIPWVKTREELFDLILERVHPSYYRLFREVCENSFYSGVLDLLLRKMATGDSTRGLVDPTQYALADQYAQFAISQVSSECKSFSELSTELELRFGKTPRPKQVLKFAKKQGLMNYNDVVNSLDRLTGIRVGFVVAAGHLPVEDVAVTRKYSPPTPNQVLETFIEEESQRFKVGGFDVATME